MICDKFGNPLKVGHKVIFSAKMDFLVGDIIGVDDPVIVLVKETAEMKKPGTLVIGFTYTVNVMPGMPIQNVARVVVPTEIKSA